MLYKDALLDELRQVERDIVEGERQLAKQERLVASLKAQNGDPGKAQAVLDMMRENQRRRDQDRQRLLSMLQP